ncbi:hypothetical protein D3C81_1373090 [compost metagenome]
MAFQANQDVFTLGPATDYPCQRSQQQVVDLCAIGGGGVLQQLPRGFTVQARRERGGMALLIAALRVVTRQGITGALQLPLPVAQLGLQFGALGVGLQVLCPGLERTGLGRQVGGFEGCKSTVRLLQVFQQDAPGNTIHYQVMDHQQQALAAVWQRSQHGAQQRALFEHEAALRIVGDLLQCRHVRQVEHPQQLSRFHVGKLGLARHL